MRPGQVEGREGERRFLRLLSWNEWQGRTVADIRRKRERRGSDTRLRIRLNHLNIATEFRSPEFLAFAEEVGGRQAETLWLRVLQYVGIHDPLGGVVWGVDRGRMGDLVLSRPWDHVSGVVGARTWSALVNSRLATETGAPAVTPEGAPEGAPGGAPAGCVEKGIEESTSAFDVDVASDLIPPGPRSEANGDGGASPESPKAPAPAPGENGASPNQPPCNRCQDGLRPGGRGTARCCDCGRGRQRARDIARASAEDRAQVKRATAAASDPRRRARGEPVAAFTARIQAQAAARVAAPLEPASSPSSTGGPSA